MAIDKKKKEAVKTVVKITDAEEKKKALDTSRRSASVLSFFLRTDLKAINTQILPLRRAT